ncbi:MAG: PEP-CTERM sorting domain-containing protein [Pseudomonadota bacterium]
MKMKRIAAIFIGIAVLLLFQSNVFATAVTTPTLAPQIVEINANKVLQFQVADNWGDGSWAYVLFNTPVTIAAHESITVSFDIFRANDGWMENLWWSWDVDVEEDYIDPVYGLQWDVAGPNTSSIYPFGWGDDYSFTPTIINEWTTIELTWNFEAETVSSSYGPQGDLLTPVDTDQPLNETGTMLYGWWLILSHDAATGTGPEIAWIDNLFIRGSDIYDSNGFEGFALGNVGGQSNSQGRWVSGTDPAPVVPEPGTVMLFGAGILCLTMLRRRTLK